jgi:hypothetical protein
MMAIHKRRLVVMLSQEAEERAWGGKWAYAVLNHEGHDPVRESGWSNNLNSLIAFINGLGGEVDNLQKKSAIAAIKAHFNGEVVHNLTQQK